MATMYDERSCRALFRGAGLRSRAARMAVVCVAIVAATATPADAQLPSLPTAQSAFPAPGLAVALDGSRGDGRGTGALAGATGTRGLQLTAAVGLAGAPAGFERSGVTAGARLAARLYRTTRLGVSAFAGYGAERMRVAASPFDQYALGGPSGDRPVGSYTQIPAGLSAGVRGVLGERPYAVSVSPMYVYARWRISDTSRARSGAHVAALAELAVTPSIAIGVAGEIGAGGPPGSPLSASRRVVGAGVSYALRRVVAR